MVGAEPTCRSPPAAGLLEASATDEFVSEFRWFVEEMVHERPLVLAFDYTHWGRIPRLIAGATLVAPRVCVGLTVPADAWLMPAPKAAGAPRAMIAAAAKMEAQYFTSFSFLSRSPGAIAAASGLGSGKGPHLHSAKSW